MVFFFLLVSPKSIKTFEHWSMLKSITSNLEVKFNGNAIKGYGVSKPEDVLATSWEVHAWKARIHWS